MLVPFRHGVSFECVLGILDGDLCLLVSEPLAETGQGQVVHAEHGKIAFDGPDIQRLVFNDIPGTTSTIMSLGTLSERYERHSLFRSLMNELDLIPRHHLDQ